MCGEDDARGMVNDIEGVRSLGGREMSRSIRDGICVCVMVMLVMAMVLVVVVVLMVVMGVIEVVMLMVVVGIVACIGVVGVMGVLCIEVFKVDWLGVVDVLVLRVVFMMEVVEGVELVVGCVVRLVLWCVNGRKHFLRSLFSLKSVEMNGLSVGWFLFGMVNCLDCFILLEQGFLDEMVGADLLLDMVVVEVVVVETVDVVKVCFFCLFLAWLFEGYDGCESGDRGCGWCGGVGWYSGVGVVEVFCSVRMGVGVSGVGSRGGGVVSGEGNASVADSGAGGEEARWRNCCRFSDGIFRELQEDLPYRFPFTLDISDIFL